MSKWVDDSLKFIRRELELRPLVEAGLGTAACGWRPRHLGEGATLLALVIGVADWTELGPLVEGGVRASAGRGGGTALNER